MVCYFVGVQPFLTVRMQGVYLDVLLAGVDWVNAQGGISHLTLEPASRCLCGAAEDASLYFIQVGHRPDCGPPGQVQTSGLTPFI